MLILTESNNPFKCEHEIPQTLQEMMDESGLTMEMFDREFSWCNEDLNVYMYAFLYEAQVAFNEIQISLISETARAILNEDGGAVQAAADKAKEANKSWLSKFTTGVQTFFKKVWDYANGKIRQNKLETADQKLKDPKIQQKIAKAAKYYTAEEIQEYEKIKGEALKMMETYTAQAQSITDPQQQDMIKKNIEQTMSLYQKKLDEFEQRHAKRVENGIVAAELQKSVAQLKSKSLEKNVIQREQKLANTALQNSQKALNAPAPVANTNAQNTNNPPTGSPTSAQNTQQGGQQQGQGASAGGAGMVNNGNIIFVLNQLIGNNVSKLSADSAKMMKAFDDGVFSDIQVIDAEVIDNGQGGGAPQQQQPGNAQPVAALPASA